MLRITVTTRPEGVTDEERSIPIICAALDRGIALAPLEQTVTARPAILSSA